MDLQKRAEALDYQADLLKAKENNLETARSEFENIKKQISEKLDSREKNIDEKEIELNKAKIEFEPKQREAESGFAKRNSETDKKIEENIIKQCGTKGTKLIKCVSDLSERLKAIIDTVVGDVEVSRGRYNKARDFLRKNRNRQLKLTESNTRGAINSATCRKMDGRLTIGTNQISAPFVPPVCPGEYYNGCGGCGVNF